MHLKVASPGATHGSTRNNLHDFPLGGGGIFGFQSPLVRVFLDLQTDAMWIIIIKQIKYSFDAFLIIGSDTCTLMFGSGWWRSDMWQPYGCMMHRYIPRYCRLGNLGSRGGVAVGVSWAKPGSF